MQKYKNLTLLGTSHISKQSIQEVKDLVKNESFHIIAIELDLNRFLSLTKKSVKKPSLLQVGPKVYLLNLIGAWVQKELGKITGISPGSEMKTAIELAKKHDLEIALIDQDISITLKRLIKTITFKEKMRFLWDIIKSPFIKEKVNFDLNKVPPQELIHKLTKEVKKNYPSVYKTLIEERNIFMAKNLNNLMNTNNDKSILALVGAGHETDIIKIIKESRGENKSCYVLLKPNSRT